jgi:hypothetical protein
MKRISLAILLATGCLALLSLGPSAAPPAGVPTAAIELAQSVPCPNGRCAR